MALPYIASAARDRFSPGHVLRKDLLGLDVQKDSATPGVAQLRLLSEALDELCSARSDEDIVRVCATLAQGTCQVSGISLVLSDGDEFHFAPGSNPDTLSHAIRSKVITHISRWSLQAGQTAVVPDVLVDERTRSQTNDSAFARSLVVVPVGKPTPFCALTFAWAHEHWPHASEVLALELLARAAGVALSHRLSHTQADEDKETTSVRDWLGSAADVEGLRGPERHHWLAMADLQYRLRNVLGLVRSLVRHTAETSRSTGELAATLEGRIGALARIHGIVTRELDAGVDLQELIDSELVASNVAQKATARGPGVRLRAKAAETLGLVVHELVANARKHGALSSPLGQVTITWHREVDGDPPCVRLDWREVGARPDIPPPAHRGFGRELIERTVPYELRGAARLLFEPDAVRCIIDIPLSPDIVVLSAAVE
jgi:two-component sensor histidine kinase